MWSYKCSVEEEIMKKKKILALALVAVMAAGLLAGCGSKSKDKTFTMKGQPNNNNFFMTTALAVSF